MDKGEENYATAAVDRYGLLKVFSRENRKKSTDAEAVIWEYLRAGRMGVKFRRQHAIADFIADFACLSQRIIVEIDGEYHQEKDQNEDDAMRDRILEKHGYKTLRYTNDMVLNNIDFVLDDIRKHIIIFEE